MHIAVLGSVNSWYVADLRRAAGGRHTIVPVTFAQLRSTISPGRVEVHSGETDLATCQALLVRSMPPGSLEQVVFRMNTLAELANHGVHVVNSPRTVEIAVDKYLATARMHDRGLLVPPTAVCQTVDAAMSAYAQLGGDIVVKPLFGGEGRGMTRVTDEAIALRAFKALEQIGAVLYLQQFVSHEGADLRLLVIGDCVLGMRRRNPSDWRTNISQGGIAEPLEVTDKLADMAHRAAQAVEGAIVGVDLLPGKDGQLYAIEVNAVPGWRALSAVVETDVAAQILTYLSHGTRF